MLVQDYAGLRDRFELPFDAVNPECLDTLGGLAAAEDLPSDEELGPVGVVLDDGVCHDPMEAVVCEAVSQGLRWGGCVVIVHVIIIYYIRRV